MRYAWEKQGIFPLDVETAVDVIDKLIDRGQGQVTKDDLLAEARRSNSPLNVCIEWDDKKAAERYRRAQVGNLIASVKRADARGRPSPQRAYVYVQPDTKNKHKAYVKLDVALRNHDMRNQMLRAAWREMARLRRKYAHYKELENIFAVMRREALKSPEAKEA